MENMANILIAEDDFAISLALKTILQNNINCHLTVCYNGQEAIDSLGGQSYDLVLSDWNMPVKTGQQLLEHIRANKKTEALPFIMLTARADRDSVIDAAKLGVTDYIHKPFNRQQLIAKIKQVLSIPDDKPSDKKPDNNPQPIETSGSDTQVITTQEQAPKRRAIIDIIVEKLKNDDFSIPVSSDITIKAIECMNQPDATSADIADIIKKDAVLSTRIIAIANSSMFRGSRDSNTLEEAITRLGMKETNNYLWVLANTALFDSKNDLFQSILTRAKLHSLATAECAQMIAKNLRLSNPTDFYYMGLLHDVGAVLLIRILEEIEYRKDIQNIDGICELLGKLHNEFGAKLLQRWKMPEKLISIAKYHEDPEDCDDYKTELNVINISNHIASYFKYNICDNKDPEGVGANSENILNLLGIPSAKHLSINKELLSIIEEKLPENMRLLKNLI